MAVSHEKKAEQLSALKEKIQSASSIIFAHYIGLTVSDISSLRSKLKKEKAELKVGKKTLIKIAMKELGLPDVPESAFTGPVACIFSAEDPVAGASVAFEFGKSHEQVKLIGGVFEGKILTASEATMFASLPSRIVLLGTFMGMANAPLRSFVSICNSPLTGFARALAEIAKKRENAPVAA